MDRFETNALSATQQRVSRTVRILPALLGPVYPCVICAGATLSSAQIAGVHSWRFAGIGPQTDIQPSSRLVKSCQRTSARSSNPHGVTSLQKSKNGPSSPGERLSRREALALLRAGAIATLAKSSGLAAGESAPSKGVPRDLHFLSLEELALQLESRSLSPLDVTRHLLDRIAQIDGYLKSYATLTPEQALADARTAEREIRAGKYRGPLHGVPIGIKDLCYTKGIRTMGGTAVRKNFVPGFDATVVSKLRDAGAIVLGKLNLSEGAAAGYNPTFDVPLNPWNPDRWPGMSSSGSGVAVAAGLCFAAIGTDTGGSIRNPSSANGVVGLKPTYGRVSRYGVLVMAESLDHVGPMARRVSDAAVMFDTIAGHDTRDPTSLADPGERVLPQLREGVRDMRIGVDRDYALKGIDAGQASAIESALRVLRDRGAQIIQVRCRTCPMSWIYGSQSAGTRWRKRMRRLFLHARMNTDPIFASSLRAA